MKGAFSISAFGRWWAVAFISTMVVFPCLQCALAQEEVLQWPIHDADRPQPRVVDAPWNPVEQAIPVPAPSDAVILLKDGDLASWVGVGGGPALWKAANGYVEVVPGAGSIRTRENFGDVQLHIEWMIPENSEGEGQNAGNSGIRFMERYEVQVLDSHGNKTYPDGQAAALYGQYPPLVNASRPDGVWQTYEIIFRRPRFESKGKLSQPAYVTVFHNGILVQDHAALTGPTLYRRRPPYEQHADRLPILLQDHKNVVFFRNIWVRDLEN